MNKEKILKLLKSPIFEDKLIGLNMLKYYTWEEIAELNEHTGPTIVINYPAGNNLSSKYYKIQEDMYAYLSFHNMLFRREDGLITGHQIIEL